MMNCSSPSLSIQSWGPAQDKNLSSENHTFQGSQIGLVEAKPWGFSRSIQIMGSLIKSKRFVLYILQQRADLKHMNTYEYICIFHMKSDDILPYWRLFTAKRLSTFVCTPVLRCFRLTCVDGKKELNQESQCIGG